MLQSFQTRCASLLTAVVTLLLCAADHPNFVWLISEDNSKHYLSLFDEQGAETPAIEQLAKHGLTFDHAFSNSPVCSVARTTLITSCYAPRIGTQFHRRSVLVPLPDGLRMFPAYLREAGYYTTNRFKEDYNAIEGDGVWDESSRGATWRNRGKAQPFFHMQSFPTSHESSLHFSADEMKAEATQTDPASVSLAPYHPDTPTFRYTYARYHDRIRQVDRQVGAVVEQLQQDDLLEDTFVFYFGDHGGVLPRSKGYAYESGLHVPLVVRIPENWRHLVSWERGTRVQGFVSFVDFGPTLLRLAGLEIPAEVDGKAFLGEGVSADEVNRRDEAFGYADRFDEKYDFVRTLRVGDYEYVRSYQPFNFDALQNNYRYRMLAYQEWRRLHAAGELNDVQAAFFETRPAEALYHVATDPHETTNLAKAPEHARLVQTMRQKLRRRVQAMPDLSFFPESYLVEHASQNPVAFGRQRRDEIARLVEIADLGLLPFAEAEPRLRLALESPRIHERYWGLIVCSQFADRAANFHERASHLAAHDPNLLVQTRAAEFLAIAGHADPGPVLRRVLAETRSPVEALLILNTVVLLRDGKPGYEIEVDPSRLHDDVREDSQVQRRLTYLGGGDW